MIRKSLFVLLLLLPLGLVLTLSLGAGWFGSNENAGTPQTERVPQRVLDMRWQRQQIVPGEDSRHILFGDFHVHTTFSYDAFIASLPVAGGDVGPHTVADACDFARYCSALDFWSVTDHAEQITPRMWRETVETVKQCNLMAGSEDNPDLVTFLGWEWTQSGPAASRQFGHKNVILKDMVTIPERPIAAPGQGAPLPPLLARGMMALAAADNRTHDLNRYLAELDAAEAVKEIARDPDELFSKLDDWGLQALVIAHSTSWGIHPPPLIDWRKQLEEYHETGRQTLLEVYSGHGDSERWIDNRRDGSAQYLLAMTDFSKPQAPRRLQFGFIAASDNHGAKPGTGYKKFNRHRTTGADEAQAHSQESRQEAGWELGWEDVTDTALKEAERFNSSWYSGGLLALHAASRSRTDIWDALLRKETYGTSGPRILLWFDLLEDRLEDRLEEQATAPMGSSVQRGNDPSFRVRAVGSFKQKPGCPRHATEAVGRERLQALCQNECYNPSQRRRRIERIEIVRIRPQQYQGEAIDPLIEDAWRVAQCPRGQAVCEVTFTDTDYSESARDTVYYARAIESADCVDDSAAPGDCGTPVQHRAWSSPIFVNFQPQLSF